MKNITAFGVKEPAVLMEALHNMGQDALVSIIETSSAPEIRKQLRTWGSKDAAEMVGKSRSGLKALEEKHNLFPDVDDKGRKQYSLELINRLREAAETRYKRPPGTDPIICCAVNFKGGSGKSMTSILLSQYLAIQGLRVLTIDLDPQATFTTWFGYIPDIDLSADDTLATSLLEDTSDIKRVIRSTYFTGIDLIPANLELENAELMLPSISSKKTPKLGSPINRLKLALETIKNDYDVIVIDCSPRTGALTINAIAAVNATLITLPPAMPDFASYVRLTKALKRVFDVIKTEHLDFFRVLLTKHKGNIGANRVDQLIRKLTGEYVLVNHMVDSAEIDNTANALLSLYEKPYATNGATYKRALEASNRVNQEIFEAFQVIWDANGESKKTTKMNKA